jgi:predicted nucleic acid-binding protein
MTSPAWYPRSVLVDAGSWLAQLDSRDDNHQAAMAIQRGITRHRPRLYVTNFLIDETYTLIRARLNHRLAVRFLDTIHSSGVILLRITPADEERAEQILRQYDDKRFSYTDATSFAVMERLSIAAAYTFDRNFTGVRPRPRADSRWMMEGREDDRRSERRGELSAPNSSVDPSRRRRHAHERDFATLTHSAPVKSPFWPQYRASGPQYAVY